MTKLRLMLHKVTNLFINQTLQPWTQRKIINFIHSDRIRHARSKLSRLPRNNNENRRDVTRKGHCRRHCLSGDRYLRKYTDIRFNLRGNPGWADGIRKVCLALYHDAFSASLVASTLPFHFFFLPSLYPPKLISRITYTLLSFVYRIKVEKLGVFFFEFVCGHRLQSRMDGSPFRVRSHPHIFITLKSSKGSPLRLKITNTKNLQVMVMKERGEKG